MGWDAVNQIEQFWSGLEVNQCLPWTVSSSRAGVCFMLFEFLKTKTGHLVVYNGTRVRKKPVALPCGRESSSKHGAELA